MIDEIISGIIEKLEDEVKKSRMQSKSYGIPKARAFVRAIEIVKEANIDNKEKKDWVDCREKLPKASGWYQVTYKVDNERYVRELYYRKDMNKRIDNIRYSEHFDTPISNFDKTDEVVAWFDGRLKPYRG